VTIVPEIIMPTESPAATTELLETLAPDRRAAMSRVCEVVREHLPEGLEEACARGMIVWQVPLRRYSDTYNGQPLWYVALASQKNYMSLHLMPAYGSPVLLQRLRDGFAAAGKKLHMGKSCIRFRAADDLALETIGDIIGSLTIDQWVGIAQAARRR
jgi:hypothetical protein